MNEQITKNQHYIPQSLLKYFSNNNKIFEALVETGKIYPTNISKSMSARYIYEHSQLDTNEVENRFCQIEGLFKKEIDDILNLFIEHCSEDIPDNICEKVEASMKRFLVFYYRSGALLTEFSFELETVEDSVLYMLEKILDAKYLILLAKTITHFYNLAIIQSCNNRFILSDQYISTAALSIKNRFFNASNRQMGLKDVIVFIPLSSEYYIVYYHGNTPDFILKNRINELNDSQVDQVNEVIINNSYKKCIGYSQNALNQVITKFKYHSPSQTFAGGTKFAAGATLKKEIFFYPRDRVAWDMFSGFQFSVYKGLKRNNPCPCGSGKKYKKCCIEPAQICLRMMKEIEMKLSPENYMVHEKAVIEQPISEFYVRKATKSSI